MSTEDEWEMFGSDSSDEDNGDECNTTKTTNTTSTTKEQSHHEDTKDRNPGGIIALESHVTKVVDEVCLFTTKELLTSSRSIPLSQRFVGVVQSDSPSAQSQTKDVNVPHIHFRQIWNNVLISRILQRNMQLVAIPESNSESNSVSPYSCDAGFLFCSFEASEQGQISEMKLQNSQDSERPKSEESKLRASIIPGGFLVLTMYIHYNDHASKTQVQRNVTHLISQWKVNTTNDMLFHRAVWDIENARLVSHQSIDNNNNNNENDNDSEIITIYLMKRPCKVNTLSCPWKANNKRVPSRFSVACESKQTTADQIETWLQYERRILAEATVALSIAELTSLSNTTSHSKLTVMTKENRKKANDALKNHGFVILSSLFSSNLSLKAIKSWSDAIMTDFYKACDLLKSSAEHNVDIFNPGKDGTFDPISYKEMAMREDLRVDLRDGPNIKKLREQTQPIDNARLKTFGFYQCSEDINNDGTKPITIDSNNSSQQGCQGNASVGTCDDNLESSLRFDPTVLDIVRSLLNPSHSSQMNDSKIPFYKGNFGRYNFNGSGPNGSPQPLRVGPIGSVISLPQAGDQAIHADTPHLFETHDCLPCHYCNLFILGNDGSKEACQKLDGDGNPTGDNEVGGTAFIHGSHKLSVAAQLTAGDEDTLNGEIPSAAVREQARDEMHMRIIRPSLEVGDALLFDTRVLHFGCANQSKKKCRPMLYVNMTHTFFHDPKNWDDQHSIFS